LRPSRNAEHEAGQVAGSDLRRKGSAGNVAKVHNWEFFSCRRCFLSFYFKVKVLENLISSGIEDHTFGPMNLREHFPEEKLTLGKNRFLEVASLVE